MVYDAEPPYTVRQTGAVDTATMQCFTRFSRYWDKVVNSGRFRLSVILLMNERPSSFHAFLGFADWLWRRAGKTCDLSPELLVDALFDYLCAEYKLPVQSVQQALLDDYVSSGARSHPRTLYGRLPKRDAPMSQGRRLVQRQGRHLAIR